MTWYRHAVAYAEMKWPRLAPHSRASLADALATITPLLIRETGRRPPAQTLRAALYGHAFNARRRCRAPAPDTASALAFLLPLILGLSMVGFIFSTVIALSPTAAEILEEGALMARIAQTSQREPQNGLGRPAVRAASADPEQAQPGDLFRPYRSPRQPLDGGRPHRPT